jgi:lysozyme
MDPLEQAVLLIKGFEGFRSAPYQNPGDRPTIGYGTTFYEDGTAVTLDDSYVDEPLASQILMYFVQRCMTKVQTLVTVSITDNQLSALTSFQYNTGALAASTLLQKINSGASDAADEFDKWVHAGGVVLQALVSRRAKEKELFLS